MKDNDIVVITKTYVEMYEEGLITGGEFEARLRELFLEPILAALTRGEGWVSTGSCCCSEHPPSQNIKCIITIEPHGFTAVPCE